MANRGDDYPGQDRDHGEDPGAPPVRTPVSPNPTPTPTTPPTWGPPPIQMPTPSPSNPPLWTPTPETPVATPPGSQVPPTPDTGDKKPKEATPETPQPIIPEPVGSAGPHRTDVWVAPDLPLPVIYGKVNNVGGQIWYEKRETSSGGLILLYLICHGEVNSITNLRFEDQAFSTFGLSPGTHYNVYTGTSGQGLDAIGSAWEPNWTSHFPNVAYVVVRIPSSVLSGIAVPDWHRFLCDVEGMKVRDPRTDATLVSRYYRDNPALCIADFMTSPIRTADDGQKYPYGAGLSDSQLDWSGTITTAANDCDTLMADATTKRFTLGWIINERKDWSLHVDAMRVQAALMAPQYNNGIYQIVMDKAQAASGYALTDSGTSAQIVAASPWRVKGSSEVPTHVSANFWDTAASYKDSPVYDDDAGIAGGTVELVASSEYRFGAMPYDQAKRLVRYMRKRMSLDKSATLYLLNDTAIELLPGMRVTVTSAQLGVSGLDVVITDLRTSTDPRWDWEMTFELYDAAVYDDTQASTTSYSPATFPAPYDTPPEVTEFAESGTHVGSTNNFAISWAVPKTRSTTTYGAGSWTATNLSSYTASKVNDGITNVTAFDWNVVGTSNIDLDLGSAKTVREFEISRSAVASTPQLWYSDDAASWTQDSSFKSFKTSTSGGITTDYFFIGLLGAGVGSHRYWRIKKADALAQADTFTEIQPREYVSDYEFVREYRVYHQTDRYTAGTFLADRQLVETIPASMRPTSTNAMDVTPYGGFTFTAQTFNTSGGFSRWYKFVVVVVNTTGLESTGHTIYGGSSASAASLGGSATYVTQSGAALTLANGLNSNIATDSGPSLQRITGPTGAFSLGGFTVGAATPVDGDVLRVYYNGSQVCTIVNEDASSTAANRIKTLTGADMVITGPLEVWFSYNVDANRWVVVRTSAAGPLYERGRAAAAGEFTAVSFSAGDYTAVGGGSWTVASGDKVTLTYSLVGKEMTFMGNLSTTTISGTVNELRVALPASATVATGVDVSQPISFHDGTGWNNNLVYARVYAGATYLRIQRLDGGNFTTGTDNQYVNFNVKIPIA